MMKNETDNTLLNEQVTAQAITQLLDENTQNLDAQTLNQLAASRQQAVAKLAQIQSAQLVDGHTQMGLTLAFRSFGDYMNQHRILAPAAMLCSAMLFAFVLTQHFSSQEVVGQGDAFLLGSDLPPEAYFDKGFDTWLAHSSQQ